MAAQSGTGVPTGGGADGTDEVADLFRALGRQIKVARERAGLSQKELGDRIGYGEETISSVERARRTPQPELLVAVDRLLDCGGLLASAAEDVERAKTRRRVRHPEWFRDYARLEAEAVELRHFANQAVPGLFQTREYARAVFASRQPFFDEETIEERVAARMTRQELMTRWPPPTVSAVVQETILRQPFGGPAVRRGQLEQFLRIGQLRHVEIQVMPTMSEEHAGMGGPFTLLTPKGKPQVAYLEVQHFSRLITDPEEVRVLAAKHGSIRGQALTPRESLHLLEKMPGDL
ncbi:helix-turn-helix domain-containing protein [Streptomyces griseomycini]|uniref:Transcriptional regulator with XRE-family HTH domain n=1 Tax=Streptomyces griseomycini TaxID=66895 RepID=A0A7W7PVB8_9ACTN|nr:helix-turn-helix transcriptional regulator [Streptomyces griseomycini]MBB4901987.1 transcriptional regulator with XRE-family HTH domain [Streptomyces griseomycini]GGR41688.1 transcriptional regulator [Streptomyces griseomycini]